MDSDTANPSKVVAKKIDKIIDMAIIDIFNSKRKGNHIFVNDVKLAWSKLTDEEKECLTNKIKNMQRTKKNVAYNVSSKDLVYYFIKHVIPYEKPKEHQIQEKRFTEMLIWANSVIECLNKLGDIDKSLRLPRLRKSKYSINELQRKYDQLVNELYSIYGRPSDNEKRILKFRLIFNKNKDILNHLLKERKEWKEILTTANIS